MIKIKKTLKKILISIVSVVLLLSTYTYAAVGVTNESLNETLQRYVQSKLNESNATIVVENNVIKVEDENGKYEIKYDLTQNPIFTIEIPIQNGMTYKEYTTEIEKLNNISLGYLAIANIQGVEFEDAYIYYALAYLENFNGSYSLEDGVVIVDDTSASEGITIEKTDDPKTFYVSDFSDRVMEYTNYMYKEEQIINDSTEIDSFEITMKKQDVTETSCTLVSTLSVNVSADFSKLKGITDEVEESFMNNDITKDNADHVITLKVGQKCKIESIEGFNGYELYGGCIEINKEFAEIIANEVGIANGYIYIGDEKKSFYIIVEENVGNETLESIILKIDNENNEGAGSTNDNGNNEFVVIVPNDTKEQDNTVSEAKEIPKAGIKNAKLYITVLVIIFVIVIGMKVKKYKEI